MKTRERTPSLRVTAVHEAGHAVIGRVLDLPCGLATIIADEGESSAGHTITGDQWAISGHWEKQGIFHRDMPTPWLARIMAYMAGAEAEKELLGACCGGDGDDQYQILLMAEELSYEGDAWARWNDRLRRYTAGHLVRRHRDKIERVAKALVERRTLQPDEIDALMRTNVPLIVSDCG